MNFDGDLDALLHRAPNSHHEEEAFFHALLKATIFTLAPLSDDHPRLRLIMFKRPDGNFFIPLFTDEAKAARAAQGALRVLCLIGREALAGTQGAMVVINPNDQHVALYPEEIAALLATGQVATFEHETVKANALINECPSVPDWLSKKLVQLYQELQYVETARVVAAAFDDNPDHLVLTIVLATPSAMGERAARATITAIQPECQARDLPVDITLVSTDGVESSSLDSGF